MVADADVEVITRMLREWNRGDVDALLEQFIDAGEQTVVVIALHAHVPGGKVGVGAQIAHVVTIGDGRILRLEGYDDPQAALAAVGIER